jgi:hypothetical protein
MNETEYLDPQKWPLTTQGNLSAHQQHMIDAMNHDELVEAVEGREQLSRHQQQILEELKRKLQNPPKPAHLKATQ